MGPTGVGKTAVALELARSLPIEIVSVDSRQVYRRMDVGTGKPSAEERRRVPHHVMDVVEPDEGVAAIGSGGPFAVAAAIALLRNTKMSARAITEQRTRGQIDRLADALKAAVAAERGAVRAAR